MTTQGTQDKEPAVVEKKRDKSDGKIDVVVRWDVHQVKESDPETGQESTHWEYEKTVLKDVNPGCPLEEHDNWIQANSGRLIFAGKAKRGDLTSTEYEKIIDKETGERIDSRIHEAAGLQEQIGVLRFAITELYNRLGETVPTELADLNSIANEEIQAGQDRKSNL